jgi:hypothetical protein
MSKSRSFVLTINNPSSYDLPQGVSEDYAIWQLETGEKGTPHLQAYVKYANAISFNTMKKVYPTAHIEAAKGSPQQCIDYCSKEDTRQEGPWERGERPTQGRRNDLDRAKDIILQDLGTTRKPLARVADECFSTFVKYHKGLYAAANEMVKPREEAPEVHVYVGGTGSGKSRAAREWLPNAWVWNPAKDKWFDGYLGHQEAIFEEFRGQLPYAAMLSILDRYTHEHQVKGGMIDFVATKIAITSPMRPEDWYPRQCEKTDSIDQLLRRITTITVLERAPKRKSDVLDLLA